MRRYTDPNCQLFIFCDDCGRLDIKNRGPCSRCSSIFLSPIFVWVEEATQHVEAKDD